MKNMIEIIEKPWGREQLIEKNDKYMVKLLTMNEGHSCSLQYHKHKHETIYVISGVLNITYGSIDYLVDHILNAGQSFVIKPFEIHRMTAIETCDYLEASTPEIDDVIRLDDKYGRV